MRPGIPFGRAAGAIAAGLALTTASPSVASAPEAAAPGEARDRVAVLPLEAPDIALRARGELADAVRVGLERGQLVTADVEVEGECEASCRAELASGAKADHLVQVTVEKDGPDWRIRGRVFARNGEPRGVADATCEICGTAELATTIEDIAAGLAADVRLTGRMASLVLNGTPSGATVMVDGLEVGQTPYEGTFAPGAHDVLLQKEGYGEQTIHWTGVEGVSESVKYELAPDLASSELDRAAVRRAIAEPFGWLGVGVGTAAIGGGVALLAIHGRNHAQTCVDQFVDPEGDCPFSYRTAVPGAIAAGVGAALLGTGIAAVVVARKRRKSASASVRRLRPTASGVAVSF